MWDVISRDPLGFAGVVMFAVGFGILALQAVMDILRGK